MAKVDSLSEKQTAFVEEYLKDLNATQAAIRAGYSVKTADKQGYQLLVNTRVADAIGKAKAARAKRTEITVDYVLTTIRDTVERCKQAEPVYSADGSETGQYKFDAGAVLKGCDLLGKHLGMWIEKREISGNLGITRIERVIIDPVNGGSGT